MLQTTLGRETNEYDCSLIAGKDKMDPFVVAPGPHDVPLPTLYWDPGKKKQQQGAGPDTFYCQHHISHEGDPFL